MHKYIPGPWIPSTTAHGEPGISILSQDRTSDGGWVRWEIARVGLNSRLITPETKATAALIAAAPIADPRAQRNQLVIEGDVPSPMNPPAGCHFHPRCPYAVARCRVESPALREVSPGRFVSCHLREAGST